MPPPICGWGGARAVAPDDGGPAVERVVYRLHSQAQMHRRRLRQADIDDAHRVLDRVPAGQPVSRSQIDAALLETGDLVGFRDRSED